MRFKEGLVAQPEVAGKIDHREMGRKVRDHRHRLAVREREEVTGEIAERFEFVRRFDKAQFGEAVEVPVHLAGRFARVLVGRDEYYLDVWMKEQNTEQLRAAVTRATEDRGFNFTL